MPSSTFTVLFLLVSIIISSPLILQIHARNIHFFSKVTPDKAVEKQSLVNKPEFVPQSESEDEHFGHETGLNPPESDAVTDRSEKYNINDKNEKFGTGNGETSYSNNIDAEKDDLLNFDNVFDNSKYGKGEAFYSNHNNNGVGTEHYTTESHQNIEESYYRGGRFETQLGQTERDSETYYDDNRFDNRFIDELNSRYKAYRGESNAGERKGLSDTRFLENGKYYYNRAYQSNEVVGNAKYDDASYGFNSMEGYERSHFNNQYDP